ncbi:MAG: ferritin family protein [Candidatus Micrarchaeia archaeon]|jgi:rubrerythrin
MAAKNGGIDGSLSEFEKRFETAFEKSDFISEGIKVALDFERESREFYEGAAKKNPDAGVRKLFEFLAGEEARHYAFLKELQESLEKNGKWIAVPAQPRLRGPDIFKLKAEDAGELGAGAETAVLSALHAEKESQYYYARLSARIFDAAGKKFFAKMADFEKTHAQLLDGMFEQMLFVRDMQLG